MSGLIDLIDQTTAIVSVELAGPGDSSVWISVLKWVADKLVPPALLAIAVSWAIPRALDRARGRREHFYKTVDVLRQQLETLQPLAASYWAKKYDPKTSSVSEETIKFLLGDIGKLMRLASEAGAPHLYATPTSPGVDAMAELIDAATGGDFASLKRLAEPQRAGRVTMASLHLLSLLADARWQVVDNGLRRPPKI